MKGILDLTTVSVIASAFILVLLCILPSTRGIFPFWVIAQGAFIADALFHEMGHTIFHWLFGQPAIPMIFTLFGADQAGGMSIALNRMWLVQIAAYGVLIYGCYWAKQNWRGLFIPAIIFSLIITALSLTPYYDVVIAYMGHGGSIAMGGFFLFRAWIYLDARNEFERWLNAFFGFYLILSNMFFSYGLAFNASARSEYSDHLAFGSGHNDFWKIAMEIPSWSVRGVGIFTIGYCVVAMIASFVFAVYLSDDFESVE